MVAGLAHVHSCGIIHRDIKPQNYLLGYGCDIKISANVKLADFGLAVPIKAVSREDQAGTTLFMAPEMINMDYWNEKVDLWSFGVTLYLFLFGKFPYTPCAVHPKEVPSFKAVASCPQPSPAFLEFVELLLAREYKRRPSAATATGMLQSLDLKAMSPSRSFSPTLHNAMLELEGGHQPKDAPTKVPRPPLTCTSSTLASNPPNEPLPCEWTPRPESALKEEKSLPSTTAQDAPWYETSLISMAQDDKLFKEVSALPRFSKSQAVTNSDKSMPKFDRKSSSVSTSASTDIGGSMDLLSFGTFPSITSSFSELSITQSSSLPRFNKSPDGTKASTTQSGDLPQFNKSPANTTAGTVSSASIAAIRESIEAADVDSDTDSEFECDMEADGAFEKPLSNKRMLHLQR